MQIPRTRALGSLVFLALGAWFLIDGLSGLPLLLGLFTSPPGQLDLEWLLPQLAYSGFHFVTGALLFAFRGQLAASLVQVDDATQVYDLTADRLEQFVLSVLGIWLFIDALANGVATEVSILSTFEQDEELFGVGSAPGRVLMSGPAWNERLRYLPTLLIGAYLFMASAKVQRYSLAVRNRTSSS